MFVVRAGQPNHRAGPHSNEANGVSGHRRAN